MEEKLFCELHAEQCPALAMAYVPCQKWQNIYAPEVGFNRGTIFADLDKPFLGGEAFDKDE